MHGDLKFRKKDLQHFNGVVVDPLQFVVLVNVDCCLYVLLVFIDIEMVFLYLVIYFCWSTPGISCLSLYLTLTNVPNFSQFQIPALIAVHVYVVIYLCDSIWSVSESVHVFFIVCLYINCRWRSSYQEWRFGTPLTVLSPPNVCDCPNLGPGFPMSFVVDCIVLSEFSWLERSCLSSFCWYWWNWWPLLFKSSLHNSLVYINMFAYNVNCPSWSYYVSFSRNDSRLVATRLNICYNGFTITNKIKNKIYHTVGTIPKSNRKTKYTTPSEQFLNQISKSLTNKCMSGHFSGLVQAQQVGMLSWFYGHKSPLLVKWWHHATAFHIWVKCQPSHIAGRTVCIIYLIFVTHVYPWCLVVFVLLDL